MDIGACGPVVMTLPSHGRNRRFKSGQAHFDTEGIDNKKIYRYILISPQ
jgi:hypothetical protein